MSGTSDDEMTGDDGLPSAADAAAVRPVRYPIGPLVVLIGISLIPVVLLAGIFVWSDGRADEFEAARDGVPELSDAETVPPITPRLETPALAYRRTPGRLAEDAADQRLSDALGQLYAFVGEASCVAVGVDDRVVSTRHPTEPVIPASTQKLVVAAVALDVLGPDYRFTTTVRAGQAVDGVLDGDLYLVGGGDPVLTSDDYPIDRDAQPAFNTTSLDVLADQVAASGITSIRGSVIGDGTRYDDEWSIPSWAPGVARVEAGPYDALLVNDGRLRGSSNRQPDPNVAAAREFARLLNARGVRVANGWSSGSAPSGLDEIAAIDSEPLTALIDEMLTTSDDDTAELMLKELAVADSGGEGTTAGGLEVVDRTLRSWGIPLEGVQLADGSGLSSDNRTTCAAMVALLQQIDQTPIIDGLPVAGRTGTLAEEFLGSAVEGRLTAKTGTLGNPPVGVGPPAVKSLAGFLDTTTGSTIPFVMILNADGVDEPETYRSYWDALAVRLAEYPAGPEPAVLGPLGGS